VGHEARMKEYKMPIKLCFENVKQRDHCENRNVADKIILKYMLKKE
jgi:hypothetical protein